MQYRGKEINTGKYVYGQSACQDENDNMYIFNMKKDGKLSASVYQIYPESLSTKSKLFTKKGKQLYYGDIIAFNNYDENKKEYFILTAYIEEYIEDHKGNCEFIGTIDDNKDVIKMFHPINCGLITDIDKNNK